MYRYIFLFLIVSLASCGRETTYDHSIDIDGDWSYDESLVYDIDITDTTQVYDLEFHLDHSDDYGYQNLYVLISTTYPDGKKVDDEVSLQLYNSRGQHLGDCGGGKCTTPLLLQERFRFRSSGMHTIAVRQHSRMSTIAGITRGRLVLAPHKSK